MPERHRLGSTPFLFQMRSTYRQTPVTFPLKSLKEGGAGLGGLKGQFWSCRGKLTTRNWASAATIYNSRRSAKEPSRDCPFFTLQRCAGCFWGLSDLLYSSQCLWWGQSGESAGVSSITYQLHQKAQTGEPSFRGEEINGERKPNSIQSACSHT